MGIACKGHSIAATPWPQRTVCHHFLIGRWLEVLQSWSSNLFLCHFGWCFLNWEAATNRGDRLSSKNLASRNVISEMGYVAEGCYSCLTRRVKTTVTLLQGKQLVDRIKTSSEDRGNWPNLEFSLAERKPSHISCKYFTASWFSVSMEVSYVCIWVGCRAFGRSARSARPFSISSWSRCWDNSSRGRWRYARRWAKFDGRERFVSRWNGHLVCCVWIQWYRNDMQCCDVNCNILHQPLIS